MLYFNFPELKEIHKVIKKEDLYIGTGDLTYGLEDTPHTTLLYGLHDNISSKNVEDAIGNLSFNTCKVDNPSLFTNNNRYEVLKFEVQGTRLHEANRALKALPYTSTFPKYEPHLTIAYIKAGKGQKYVEKLNQIGLNDFKLEPTKVVYSTAEGKDYRIKTK